MRAHLQGQQPFSIRLTELNDRISGNWGHAKATTSTVIATFWNSITQSNGFWRLILARRSLPTLRALSGAKTGELQKQLLSNQPWPASPVKRTSWSCETQKTALSSDRMAFRRKNKFKATSKKFQLAQVPSIALLLLMRANIGPKASRNFAPVAATCTSSVWGDHTHKLWDHHHDAPTVLACAVYRSTFLSQAMHCEKSTYCILRGSP